MIKKPTLEEQIKELREIIKEKRENHIPKKTAATEAHTHIITGRNIGVVGIGGVTLTLMVALINNIAASVTAFVTVGILGYMVYTRTKTAQYLENKYGLKPKPIFNNQYHQNKELPI